MEWTPVWNSSFDIVYAVVHEGIASFKADVYLRFT